MRHPENKWKRLVMTFIVISFSILYYLIFNNSVIVKKKRRTKVVHKNVSQGFDMFGRFYVVPLFITQNLTTK